MRYYIYTYLSNLKKKQHFKCYLFYIFIGFSLIFPPAVFAQQEMDYESIQKSYKEGLGLMDSSYTVAIDFYEGFLKEMENQALTNDTIYADVLHKIAVCFYSKDDSDMKIAINNFKKALAIRERHYSTNHPIIIKTNRNIGASFNELGQLDSAKFYLERAIDLNRGFNQIDEKLLASLYKDLGEVLSNKEDFDNAEHYLLNAYQLHLKLYKEEPWELGSMYSTLLSLYQRKEDYTSLKTISKEAVSTFQSIEDKYEADFIVLADAYNNLGIAYSYETDSLDLAIFYINQSLVINQEYQIEEEIAINYSNLSTIYKDKEESERSLKYINQAIKIDKQLNNKVGLADDLNNKMEVYLAMNQLDNALSTQQQVLQTLVPNFQPKDILENPTLNGRVLGDLPSLVTFLAEKANLLHQLYLRDKSIEKLAAAIAIYDLAGDWINKIRLNFQADESKRFLSKKAKFILQEAIIANVTFYRDTKDANVLEKIFLLIEQSKSMIVLDALSETNAAKQAGIPAIILEREKKIKEQINQLEKSIALGERGIDQTTLITLNRQLELLQDSLKQQYPKYAELKYTTEKITPKDIALKPNQTLIDYFVTKELIYAFILGEKGMQLIEMPNDFPLNNWVSQLQKGLLTYHLEGLRSKKQYQAYADTLSQTAHQLYEKLFAPIAETYPLTEELIIIPDGILGYLPFDILVKTPSESTIAFGTQDYLLNDYQISYCYSATLLKEMRDKIHESTDENLIAFAPVFPEGNQMGDNRSPLAIIRSGLSPLNYNIPEVEAINKIISGNILTAEEANEDNFLEFAPNYKIIHLSTHGKANDEIGDYAYLAFTEIPDTIENEILYNRDLYNLQLNADMVVLSACETGIGELQKGEGIISLARGFSYAGAKSIITTLWSVNDAKTKELMESFYTHLKTGLPKDKALRQAKLDFIDRYSHDAHPFFWAAFIPVGDMAPIQLEADFPWLLIGVTSLFLIILLFFLKKRFYY